MINMIAEPLLRSNLFHIDRLHYSLQLQGRNVRCIRNQNYFVNRGRQNIEVPTQTFCRFLHKFRIRNHSRAMNPFFIAGHIHRHRIFWNNFCSHQLIQDFRHGFNLKRIVGDCRDKSILFQLFCCNSITLQHGICHQRRSHSQLCILNVETVNNFHILNGMVGNCPQHFLIPFPAYQLNHELIFYSFITSNVFCRNSRTNRIGPDGPVCNLLHDILVRYPIIEHLKIGL